MNENKRYKYKEIEESILEGIKSGEYQVDQLLPTENQLSKKFGVSRMTVYKAIKRLEKSSFVKTIKGSGTYVHLPKLEQNVVKMVSFSESYSSRGYRVSTKLLLYQVKKASEYKYHSLAKNLYIKDNDELHHFVRLRYINDKPIAIQYYYVPVTRIKEIDIKSLEDSFYNYLENNLKISLGNGESVIDIILPNDEIKSKLNLEDGVPVVHTYHVSCFKNGIPFELMDTYTVYDKFNIKLFNRRF